MSTFELHRYNDVGECGAAMVAVVAGNHSRHSIKPSFRQTEDR